MKQSKITVPVVNSIALFIYTGNYTDQDSYIEIYNAWRDTCEFQLEKIPDVILLLQYVQTFLHTPKEILKEALLEDGLL